MAKIGKICKEHMIKELTDKLRASQGIFVTEFTGLNVLDIGRLKTVLKLSKASYIVVKNSLGKMALKNVKNEELLPYIEGTVGLVVCGHDPIGASRALMNFRKGSEKLKVKAGVLDGKVISEADIKTLAALPSREVLLARVFGGMKAPISGFVTALNETISKFVYAINAVKDKKEKTKV